jgi:hypothetical protein
MQNIKKYSIVAILTLLIGAGIFYSIPSYAQVIKLKQQQKKKNMLLLVQQKLDIQNSITNNFQHNKIFFFLF